VAPTRLTSASSITNATTFTTSPITPGADTLVVAFIASVGSGFNATAPSPVVTGNGLVWEQVDTAVMGNNNSHRLTVFAARGGAASSGPVTLTFTATQDLCAWSIFQYDAVPGAVLATITQHTPSTVQSVATLSLSPSPAISQYEVAVGGVLVEAPNQSSRVVAPGAGCTQIDNQAATQQFPPSVTLHTEDRADQGAISWTWNGNANAAAIVLAVKVSTAPPPPPPPLDPVEALVRKFEPILFFGKGERSFPSDAKRFVENCALWQATPPLDDKKSWGTSPRVEKGQLAAAAGEPGTSLATESTAPGIDPAELFLEFGGWLDKSGTPQPDITATSTHPYANRGAIRDAYANDPMLNDSQFWYHAEFFDTERLLHLAEQVQAPDLHKTATANLKNPALLCYYLFFPEHERSVSGAGNIEAAEAGSHAGQWACIALLLERDTNADPYDEPSFVGFTGSPTVPPTAMAVDEEFRTAMKLAKWRPAGAQPLPQVTEHHPHFFVSLRSHSLYLDDADHQVAPFPSGKEPSDNGRADTPFATPGQDEDLAMIIVKLSNPVGWIALGIEALFGEDDYLWAEFGTVFPAEVVPPDASATTGGTTVHPVGVTEQNTWPNPQTWRSARNVTIGARHYDFLVDRATQPWWPSDDGRQGFRGRWGQRVETDPFTRRAGVRFPEFWRMFLLAWEDGQPWP
jgi:hypothetical protein